jgi:hypothetical protein
MAALTCVFSLIPALSAQNDSPEPQFNQWQIARQNLSNTWSSPQSIQSAQRNIV